MSIRIFPNVVEQSGYIFRSIWLDDTMQVFPISRKLKRVGGLVSSQRIDTGKKYHQIGYDPVMKEIVGWVHNGLKSVVLSPDALSTALDKCGIGLLVWLCDDSLTPRDIGYYVDPLILKEKQIIERHQLRKVFPNMTDAFVRHMASYIQHGVSVLDEPLAMHAEDFPTSTPDPAVLASIVSPGVRRISNNPRVYPKIVTSESGIPVVLPISYFRNTSRDCNFVTTSIYLTLEDGSETVINLDEYLEELNPPVGWFTSILYTLPKDVKQVCHVIHRPFITGRCQRNRGTVITVYTA